MSKEQLWILQDCTVGLWKVGALFARTGCLDLVWVPNWCFHYL